jgi:hypothetical protein
MIYIYIYTYRHINNTYGMYRACRKRSQLTSKGDFRGSPKTRRSAAFRPWPEARPARPCSDLPRSFLRCCGDGGPNGWVWGIWKTYEDGGAQRNKHIHIVDSKLILYYWHLLTWYFEYLMNPSTSMWSTISAPRLLVNAIVFSLKTTRKLSWCNGWRVAMRVAMGSSTKICWLFP